MYVARAAVSQAPQAAVKRLQPSIMVRASTSSLLALAPVLLAAVPTISTAADVVLRFPIEGGGVATVCGASAATASTAAVGTAGLRAQVREVSTTLDIPSRTWYGPGRWINDTSLGPWRGGLLQTVELPAPARLNSSCVSVSGGSADAAGPGMLYVSSDNGTTWGNGTRAEWYETVAVAYGLRPYINEVNASLLVWADGDAPPIESVSLELPFATPPQTVTWAANSAPGLSSGVATLAFPLAGLPLTINQDTVIRIALSGGRSLTKTKRLMRAPPLPASSTALPVQVDHKTRGLRLDGRPYTGIGWYLDGLEAGAGDGIGFASYTNFTDYLVHAQAPLGMNQGMLYRLFTYPEDHQLAVLDELARGGFKVMYEVGEQLSDCGDPIQAELRGIPGLCFNDTSQLAWLHQRIKLVRDHPALLGYHSTPHV